MSGQPRSPLRYLPNSAMQNSASQGVPQAPRAKIPSSAAPPKCELEMPIEKFRTWRTSMEWWLKLNSYGPTEVSGYIRLQCVPDLQEALDSRYSVQEWSDLTANEALNAIKLIAVLPTNQAADKDKFYSLKQGTFESISAFFTRSYAVAACSDFKCPNCEQKLGDYLLLSKIATSLSDSALKTEVFRAYDAFNNISDLRMFCLAFETARKSGSVQCVRENPAIATASAQDHPLEIDDDVTVCRTAMNRQKPKNIPSYKQNSNSCNYCDRSHAAGRKNCPAWGSICGFCKKPGHWETVCKNKKWGKGEAPTSGAVCAAGAHLKQPTTTVEIHAGSTGATQTLAVADTGAMVCVAGPKLFKELGLNKRILSKCGNLKDVADRYIEVWGYYQCCIELNGHQSYQNIYFIPTAKGCFLSLEACKELKLVHEGFPGQISSVGGRSVAATQRTCAIEQQQHVPSHVPPATTTTHQQHPATPVSPTSYQQAPQRHKQVPFPPSEENIERLQEWLLQHFSGNTFNTDRDPLPIMEGKPHNIHLKDNAVPYACNTPAEIAKHWEAEVKQQLDKDVEQGIIEKVPQGEPTHWCARMVVVAKRNGKPRRTVDYQKLNSNCLRETHHTPTPFNLVSGIPQHTYKTVADAHCGFHQSKLNECSSKLTTFVTPWGRYRYLRTPMGLSSSTDAYTRKFDDAIEHIERKLKCVDDILLYDCNIENAFWHAYDFLETCARKGITLNPEKFKFCQREVEFVGYSIGWEAYGPTEERLSAVRDFHMPAKPSITDIRSWFGLVNQLAPFLATAPVMQPFRDLLKKPATKSVYWDSQLEAQFRQSKEVICKLARDGLAYFECTRPTIAITDWSKEGIGFVVLQQYCSCTSTDTPFCCRDGWRLALCGSRHLTKAEVGYAPVEGEALAVAWCLRKARLFLLGCPNLTLITDHKPLVKLFGQNKELKDILNPRLLALKEKTLLYSFNVKYLPGKKNPADFFSRYPALRAVPDNEDEDLATLIETVTLATVVNALHSDCATFMDEHIQKAATDDQVYQMLIAKVLHNDWHDSKSQEATCMKPFYNVRDRLTVVNNLVIYSFEQGPARFVVPEGLRDQIAANLHASHQGLDSMLRRARQTVYWPGIEGDLQHHRSSCNSCNVHAPSQPAEPLIMTPPPEYPFQQTAADLCQQDGHNYLIYADRLTGWLEIAHLPNDTTSGKLIKQFRSYFVRNGAPEEISTDGGTNLVSEEMCKFFNHWGAKMRISSAHFPQSNGRAEAAVKSAKRLLRDNTGPGGTLNTDKFSVALLQYLNTPLRGINKSPAQLATGRQLRDGVPAPKQHYKVDVNWRKTLRDRELQMAESNQKIVDKGTQKALSSIVPGSRVWVQNQASLEWDKSGVVTEALANRQYTIRLDGSGRLSRRNRRHIRPLEDLRPATTTTGQSDVTPPNTEESSHTPQRTRPRRARRKPNRLTYG